MRFQVNSCVSVLLLVSTSLAASKPHSVVLGGWTTVKWVSGDDDQAKPVDLRIRPLIVDEKTKEWITGSVHEVTERTFVAQRVYRLNDSLPQESGAIHWRWERGAWLLIDRVTGKVQAISLPLFDAYASSVSWFRDYAAYCGISEDGKKQYAVVAQLGRRKPLLKQALTEQQSASNELCPAPVWARGPARVTFAPTGTVFTYTIEDRAVDVAASDENEPEE